MPKRKNADELGEERAFVTIALTPKGNEIITHWLDVNGGSKQKLVQSILQFFADAPDSIKQIMARTVPSDLRPEFARRASEYFMSLGTVGELRPETNPTDAEIDLSPLTPDELKRMAAKKPQIHVTRKKT